MFLFYHGMGLSRCDSIFSLALPFLHSFVEMGSLMYFVGMVGLDSKLSGVDL